MCIHTYIQTYIHTCVCVCNRLVILTKLLFYFSFTEQFCPPMPYIVFANKQTKRLVPPIMYRLANF